MQGNQLIHAIPQRDHALDTLGGGGVQLRFDHAAVFPVVHLAVHHGVGVVFHIGVCGDGRVDLFALAQLWQFRLLIGAANVFHGIMELICKCQPLNGDNGKVLLAVLGAFGGLPAEDHLRVVNKIAVDGKAILVLAEVYPIRFDLNGTVTLLEKENVRNHIRTGVGAERIVGQTNGTQQLRPLRDVPADFGRLLVHRVAGGHKRDHAARTHLVEGFGKEVVVNGKTELVISPVIYLILSERDVAHGEVVKVFSVRCFKARDGNVRLGIKLLGNTSGDAVQLHAVELAALHLLRQQAKEVADAHRRLQNVTALEAHIADRFIDRLDDGRAGVVGVQRGRSGRSVFLRGECGVQLCKLVRPVWLILVEGIRKTAPAHIAGEDFLLLRAGL